MKINIKRNNNLKDVKEWLKALFCFWLSILCIAIITSNLKILISETDSLPYHYFLNFPKLKPNIYDYTVVHSDWYQGKIIKQIIGIAGDKIRTNDKGEICVNHFKIRHKFSTSSDQRPLTSIKDQTIPTGYVFLYSNHPKSFDSRYQELGLIPVSDLQGLVVPIW